MSNILQITQFTIREALARKVFIFFGTIILFVLLSTLLVFMFVDIDTLTSLANQSGRDILIREIVSSLELLIVTPLANLGLLLAIFSSASFVPVMLEKGNIDLLLSKPISRAQLLLGKYFGGKDHTTIMYACQKVETMAQKDRLFQKELGKAS